MSLNEKMTALADAVRSKANRSDTLTIDAMTEAVNGLVVGNPSTQTLTVTPTKEQQTFSSSDLGENTYYSTVTVNAIPSEYVITSDATAEKFDIIEGKTAYVNGEKVTGVYKEVSEEDVCFGVEFGAFDLYGGTSGIPEVLMHRYGSFTGDATAEAEDIAPGKTAYVKGVKIEGSMPAKQAETYTPGTADITIKSGVYLAEDQTIKGDGNLTAENIKAGVSIFNVDGTFTSDADAADADIAEGKTAYVNGVKVVGTATGGGVNRLWIYKDGIITSPVASDLGNSSIQVPSRPGDMTFYVAADGMIIYKHDFDFNSVKQSKVRPVTQAENWTIAKAWRDTGKGVAVKDGRLYLVSNTYDDNDRNIIPMEDTPENIVELGHSPYERGCFVLTESADAYFVNPEYSGTCAPKKVDIKISKLLNQAPITDYGEEINQPAIDADGRVVLLNGSREGSPSVTVLFADKAFDSPFVNYYHYNFEDYGEGGGGYSFAVNDRGMLFSRNASTGETAEVQNISSICQEKFLGFCHTDLSYSFDDDTGEEKMVPEPRTAAFCIAIDGTLWKLTAGCNSSGNLTGVVSEQVGEDTDWQYVPPCLSKGSSGFAQKGGKLYRLHFNNDLSTRLEEFYPSPTGKLIAVSWDDKGLWFDKEVKDVTSCGVLK